MFQRLIEWNRRRKEWNAKHIAAWQTALAHRPEELSTFQAACESELAVTLEQLGLHLVARKILGPLGHKYIEARIDGTSIEIWIHDDTAGWNGSRKSRRFEEWDYLTPDDLVRAFCEAVAAEVDQARPSTGSKSV